MVVNDDKTFAFLPWAAVLPSYDGELCVLDCFTATIPQRTVGEGVVFMFAQTILRIAVHCACF